MNNYQWKNSLNWFKKVAKVVTMYDEQMEATSNIPKRRALRGERKYPKQVRKQLIDFVVRKQKYQQDLETFGTRNSYSNKT
ncbi:hypothetical protein BACCIP111883_01675 [Sutcliffiella rhizosphaerae]|uniref:Transposase n=1 Tax=Sutcliffiella rhizosphaerae TaxID=2880967 RepID=A0ABN8ACX1_9BACI|nr:hypothetical protein BACCIP111883_01675 [Sutcliffiella rhizosphaerae]